MSMELWTYPWMESFFGNKAEQYRKGHLADALKKIPYMLYVDEYQHRVYRESGDDCHGASGSLKRDREGLYAMAGL